LAQLNQDNTSLIQVETTRSGVAVHLRGDWTLSILDLLSDALRNTPLGNAGDVVLKGEELAVIDTAGAMLLIRWLGSCKLTYDSVSTSHQQIIELVRDRLGSRREDSEQPRYKIVAQIGRVVTHAGLEALKFLSFFGQACANLGQTAMRPAFFRIREFFVQLQAVCAAAIGVVALVTFLIGVVVAYLMAMQVEKYGANIFVVNGVALAMCRELSPIIVAIIMAGRSGSAFTAQIGAMKLNEEVDALVTLGLSPMHVLVLPRVLALMLALPLLVFVGDVVGIFGGMVIADSYLGITTTTFLDRLQVALPVRSFLVGLIKAPVFAFFIALIGCRRGLAVEGNARSLGLATTATVVESIVLVILLNACFAVIFAELGI